MSVIKGLKNINALLDKPKYENDGPKIKWLKLADGQSVFTQSILFSPVLLGLVHCSHKKINGKNKRDMTYRS